LNSDTSPVRVSYRTLVVEDDTLVAKLLQKQLENSGHVVVGQAASEQDAETLFREKQPDLVLMDIRLNHGDGIDLATRLLKMRTCPIVIVSAYSDPTLVDRATAAGVFGYLIKPTTEAALGAQIEVAVARCREQMVLRAEKEALAQTLEARKLVERAKGILMKHLSLTEGEAHRRLQTESQNRRISLPDLARKIIESEELIGGK
jgi:two-component system, response regulator PdtaR